MFGVDSTEFIIVAIAAIIFIGPKDMPAAMRAVGRWVGKVRGMARHFHTGIESMIREAELEEMEKSWRAENERIMRDYPAAPEASAAPEGDPAQPSGDVPPPSTGDTPPAQSPGDTPPAPRPPDARELP